MSSDRHLKKGDVITSSLYAGGAAGVLGAGLIAGHATLKGRSAILWGSVAGGQCFVLGSTFWFSRSLIQSYLNAKEDLATTGATKNDLISSGTAGSIAGMVGGALRGPRNILPGAIMLSLMGVSGQLAYTSFAAFADSSHQRRPVLDVLSDSRWWPLKSISDEDYEHELTEKVIAIEAELSIIDERIQELKQKLSEATTKP